MKFKDKLTAGILLASLFASPSSAQTYSKNIGPIVGPYSILPVESALYFPMTRKSFERISENFGDRRERSGHKATDIYGHGEAIAMADGIVVQTNRIMSGGVFTTCRRGDASFVLIYHPGIDRTILYGEINLIDAHQFEVGQVVRARETLARFDACGMLHVEAYEGELGPNPGYDQWPVIDDHCRRGRPAHLVDYTDELVELLERDAFYR